MPNCNSTITQIPGHPTPSTSASPITISTRLAQLVAPTAHRPQLIKLTPFKLMVRTGISALGIALLTKLLFNLLLVTPTLKPSSTQSCWMWPHLLWRVPSQPSLYKAFHLSLVFPCLFMIWQKAKQLVKRNTTPISPSLLLTITLWVQHPSLWSCFAFCSWCLASVQSSCGNWETRALKRNVSS